MPYRRVSARTDTAKHDCYDEVGKSEDYPLRNKKMSLFATINDSKMVEVDFQESASVRSLVPDTHDRDTNGGIVMQIRRGRWMKVERELNQAS